MKIESTDQDIRTLLGSGYYLIPRFQRAYSWDRENIQDFWDDIVREQKTDYFIGSMVVYKDGAQTYGVVDGQQRLTTITILLCVLRNIFQNVGEANLADGLHGLIERRNIENKEKFILTTETSYPFFQDSIQQRGQPQLPPRNRDEDNTLQRTYEHFNDLVSALVKSVKEDPTANDKRKKSILRKKLTDIRDSLLGLKIILVKLDNEDDAYIIFETLNTRGKDLALADLVKNHLARCLKPSNASHDPAKEKWTQILEIIEGASARLSTDAFIHHFWLSRYDYLPAKKLFKVLRKRFANNSAQELLDNLLADATLYRTVHEVSFSKWKKEEAGITASLAALQLFRVQQPIPCVLSLMRAYDLDFRHYAARLFLKRCVIAGNRISAVTFCAMGQESDR